MSSKSSLRVRQRLVLGLSFLVTLIETGFGQFWYRPEGADTGFRFLVVAGLGFVFFALGFLLLRGSSKAFGVNLAALQDQPKEYRKALSSLGAVPLKLMLVFIILGSAFLVLLFTILPVTPGLWAPVFVLHFALSLVNAAFVFVLSDSQVTKVLLSHSLSHFPSDLRDGRQARKTFIIPMFMTVMAILFTSSITYLILARAAAQGGELGSASLGVVIAASLFYLVLVTILVGTWNRTTAKIYQSITVQLDNLNSADKDLRGRISVPSVDELGTIAGLVNQFSRGLERNIIDLKVIERGLSEAGEGLGIEARGANASSGLIANATVALKERTEVQSRSVDESSAAIHEITKNVESLDQMILSQASSIAQASASVEEMVGSMGSINTSIERMATEFSGLAGEAEKGRSLQNATGTKMQTIVERSESLQEANKTVTTIAAQTNLLAMNAAIEAAHAGDAGRGFSVVADEIRRLADTSSKESRRIKVEITQVQNAIHDVVGATKASEQSFAAIVDQIQHVGNFVKELHSAVVEQNEGAQQILEALRVMKDVTQQVQEGSREMRAGSGIISAEMAKVTTAGQDVNSQVEALASIASRLDQSGRKVAELVETTETVIGSLNKVIAPFRTHDQSDRK